MDFFTKNHITDLSIIIWIGLLLIMVFLIIVIGGLTRLTDSGLSMVDWRPIMGIFPPITHQSWIEVFNKYKLTPEFKIVNYSISLDEFKYIFWWEWFHRFFARLIGLFFIVPFIYFCIKKKLSKNLLITIIIVFIFGFFQAIVGWWMVKSGLSNDPYVSAYRLAFHLVNALIIFSILFWLLLSLIYGIKEEKKYSKVFKFLFHIKLILIFITIVSGALMAGTDAGKSFNTFPLMNDQFFPDGYYISEYGWKNYFENTIAINFNHRWLAMFTFIFISAIVIYMLNFNKEKNNNFSLILILVFLLIQILLGILTLINEVQIVFASLHQINAVLLLASIIFAYNRLIYK